MSNEEYSNKGDTSQAVKFLQSNRELRLNPDINQKVRFIYTGSIGLNHTVAAIKATAFVNDLNSIEVEPLHLEEAIALVNHLLADKQIEMNRPTIEYLLGKINWLIPFHIQLSIQEIAPLCSRNQLPDATIVDKAFDNMIAVRNNNHFEHYYSRLKSQFKNKEFQFAENILQRLSFAGNITIDELYDTAVKYEVEKQYKQILDILIYDGYINNNGLSKSYQFNSPVVQLWWQKYICK